MCAASIDAAEGIRVFEFFRGLLSAVLTFYAWTVGVGLLALCLIMLGEGAYDLYRDWRRGAWPAGSGHRRRA